jgi:hypothetical protein
MPPMPSGSGHIDGGMVKPESLVALEYFLDGETAVFRQMRGGAGDINKSFVGWVSVRCGSCRVCPRLRSVHRDVACRICVNRGWTGPLDDRADPWPPVNDSRFGGDRAPAGLSWQDIMSSGIITRRPALPRKSSIPFAETGHTQKVLDRGLRV